MFDSEDAVSYDSNKISDVAKQVRAKLYRKLRTMFSPPEDPQLCSASDEELLVAALACVSIAVSCLMMVNTSTIANEDQWVDALVHRSFLLLLTQFPTLSYRRTPDPSQN